VGLALGTAHGSAGAPVETAGEPGDLADDLAAPA
jgi:hypothetical protein